MKKGIYIYILEDLETSERLLIEAESRSNAIDMANKYFGYDDNYHSYVVDETGKTRKDIINDEYFNF